MQGDKLLTTNLNRVYSQATGYRELVAVPHLEGCFLGCQLHVVELASPGERVCCGFHLGLRLGGALRGACSRGEGLGGGVLADVHHVDVCLVHGLRGCRGSN